MTMKISHPDHPITQLDVSDIEHSVEIVVTPGRDTIWVNCDGINVLRINRLKVPITIQLGRYTRIIGDLPDAPETISTGISDK